jgi:hypothetical protein
MGAIELASNSLLISCSSNNSSIVWIYLVFGLMACRNVLFQFDYVLCQRGWNPFEVLIRPSKDILEFPK